MPNDTLVVRYDGQRRIGVLNVIDPERATFTLLYNDESGIQEQQYDMYECHSVTTRGVFGEWIDELERMEDYVAILDKLS